MDRAVFDRMAELDQHHWWFLARRDILSTLLDRAVGQKKGARILEIGCGTGHNFSMLGRFGTVDALEIDDKARDLASTRLGRAVGDAALPALDGVEDGAYDVIALLDVLEHVEGDEAALLGIRKKLKPGGKLLITVPANKWMWSAHDVAHHHHRRYARGELLAVARKAGFRVDYTSHFNTVLFPLIAAARIVGKLMGRDSADDAQPPAAINATLRGLFAAERHIIGRTSLPFGVSLVTILS